MVNAVVDTATKSSAAVETSTNRINGQIYKICSDSTHLVYIGSTIKTLEERFKKHQSTYKRWLSGKLSSYVSSIEIFKLDPEPKIEFLEKVTSDKIEDLRNREYELIYLTKNCVNKITRITSKNPIYIPRVRCDCGTIYIDTEELREKHLKSKNHSKNIALKELIAREQELEPKRIKCPCGGDYRDTPRGLEKHLISSTHWDYEKSIAPKPTKIKCPCGGVYTDADCYLYTHLQTKKHINYLNKLANPKPTKIKCPCGGSYTDSPKDKFYHLISERHIDYEDS